MRPGRLPHPTRGVLRAVRARQRLVTAGLFVFVIGSVVAPAVHNLNHRADHTHDLADGVADQHPHSHGHTHGAPAAGLALALPPSDTTAGAPTDQGLPPGPHGRGSAAHFGVTLTPTTAFALAPAATALARITLAPPPAAPVAPDRFDSRTSRGPPLG